MILQAIIVDKFESNSKGRLLVKKKRNPKEDFKAEC